VNTQPQDPETQQPRASRPHLSPFWWIVLIVLLIWNGLGLLGQGTSKASIPYTTFIQQVKAGNITSVQIQGNQITGGFAEPFMWPHPSPASTAAAGSSTPGSPQATPQTYTEFSTLFPETVGDPNLISLLEQRSVQVRVENPALPWFTILLTDGLPLLLLVGVILWMGRGAMRSQSGILSFGRTKARQVQSDRPMVSFADVAGADEAKQDLQQVVDFLRNPKRYHDLGARIPRGVLLVGPPGTGKTLLARAVAGEADVPFFNLSASEFVEMFVGVGASRVRDLFKQAKSSAPSIVFIDEMDAVGRRRGAGLGAVNDEREQTLNQLLVEMDGFDERHEVILLAATNRPDVLDPALLRPGRFDRQVIVGMPDRKGRLGILKIHTRDLPLGADVKLEAMSAMTAGMSGADLANLCNEAALLAAQIGHDSITMDDFEGALDKIILGAARPLALNEEDRRVIANHEAGHAVVAWFSPDADPVHKVTIIPHGMALGVTEQSPGEDKYNYGREYLLARLAVMMGGRAAEELAIGEITTGAENDLKEATHLARRMVTQWGMTEFGLMTLDADDAQPFLGYELAQGRGFSEATAARVDQGVQQLLQERYEYTCHCLAEHRDALDALVDALMEHETVTQEEMGKLIGPRPSLSRPADPATDIARAKDS
jgi:cell division protease FtsH